MWIIFHRNYDSLSNPGHMIECSLGFQVTSAHIYARGCSRALADIIVIDGFMPRYKIGDTLYDYFVIEEAR